MKNITGNSIVIKEVNINLVRKALKEMSPVTKQQIAAATGLTAVTVGTVLQQLLSQNEAFEVELSSSSGGRPAHQFKYNPDYAHALVIFPTEINRVVKIHSTVVNLFGETVYKKNWEVPGVALAAFEKIIDEMILSFPNIQSIGFGLPGAEYDGKMIVSDYKELMGVPIIDYFSAKYKRPVIMENDVNAAVIGYSKRKQITNEAAVVYIFFPGSYPPGAGILINERLYKGKSNFAGEVANIPLNISWTDPNLYTSFIEVSEGIAKLIIAVSSVLNPDTVVLYGDFLSSGHIAKILEKCGEQLPENAVPKLQRSEDFFEDYLNGMIIQTLKTIESSIVLSRI